SRALPLLYSAEMARRVGITSDAEIKKRVQTAIDRLAEMQDSSGAFGLWGPGSPDLWLTSYVTDFLTRAKEAGDEVRAEVISQALDRLANYAANVTTFDGGGESRAYAHYVLARSGRGQVGELRYLVDSRLERFVTALAQAHLGAALSMVGDKERAERVIRAAILKLDGTAPEVTRLDYGSRLRDGAAVVTLIAETGVART
ncbi:MAG TPA: alpha-2-macroglobulin family protein, partial [Hyphomicrobiaceae bacterium]|nr:alpha-2-macroglobulin family protein [Hyphomicrobiaceae bacterium]